MKRLLFDIEADGLLDTITKVHCIACIDVDTGEARDFKPWELEQGIAYLSTADILIAHNGLRYDFPALEKLHGFVVPFEKKRDTLVIARLIHPNVKENDSKLNKTLLAQKKPTMGDEFGRHTLKAWGIRLKENKAAFEGPWEVWTQEMHDYCIQDIQTNLRLWKFLDVDRYSQAAIELEHRVAVVCEKITQAGWPFDMQKAGELHAKLTEEKFKYETRLKQEFGGWWKPKTKHGKILEFTPKVTDRGERALKRGYVAGQPCTQIEWEDFNPSSRPHMMRVLQKLGWKPTEFTEAGTPKMDEEIIEGIAAEYPQADGLTTYLMLEKRLGQLADGDKAWLKHVGNDLRVHGEYNPMGAVTSRAAHFRPNLAQVPAASSPYGHECRELFTVPPGWEAVGADMEGLEGRCFAHYLAKHDEGRYGDALLSGDPHWAVVLAVGYLPTNTTRDKSHQLHTILRETGAKRLFYGMLYGSGDEKAGRIVLEACRLAVKTNPEWAWVYQKFFGDDLNPGVRKLRQVGQNAKLAVISGIEGFDKLKHHIEHFAETHGKLPGLDMRRVPVRKAHAALNTLLQSCGAILCKRWLCDADDALMASGLKWHEDYTILGWVHDEIQIACRIGLGDRIGEVLTSAARQAGVPYGFRIRLDSKYVKGRTWADTH
jgi:DNA polymerase-1